MPTINATVFPDEAYVLVQADWSGTILRDTFQRIAATTWAPGADTGQVYAVESGAGASFPVNGIQGQIVHTAVNTTRRLQVALGIVDSETSGVFYNPVTPTGNNFILQVIQRFLNTNNLVDARFSFNSAGTVSVQLRQIIAGVATASANVVVAGLLPAGVYGYRFLVQGGLLAARIWNHGTPEPSTWNVTLATTWLTAGSMVIGTVINAGVTNPVPITFAFDNLLVVDPNAVTTDCAIVTRRNTVTGEIVRLRPYISYNPDGALLLDCGLGLWWDTEPPLNVALEYCTFACDADVLKSQNPGFEVNATGWTATGGVLTQDCTVAKVGTCSGRLTPSGTDAVPSISQSGIVLSANAMVTVSAWAMSPQGWNSVILRLDVTYADLSAQRFETGYVTLDDNEWRFLSFGFVPTQAITNATLTFIAGGIPPNTTLFNVDEIQVTQLQEVGSSTCETVTVESDSVWLKSPLHPCLDVEVGLCSPALADCGEDDRVSYAGTFDDNFVPNTAVLGPANRRRPIPISRTRRDAAATLRLLAHDCQAKDAVLAINEPGDPLLFQAPAQYCIPDRYISVGTVGENRFSVDQREEFRLMDLPYVTVDRPPGPADGICGARMQDLCGFYTSWNAMSIAGLSYEDLLVGLASPDGPGQDPDPDARTWDDVETEFADWDAVEGGGTRDFDELRDGL